MDPYGHVEGLEPVAQVVVVKAAGVGVMNSLMGHGSTANMADAKEQRTLVLGRELVPPQLVLAGREAPHYLLKMRYLPTDGPNGRLQRKWLVAELQDIQTDGFGGFVLRFSGGKKPFAYECKSAADRNPFLLKLYDAASRLRPKPPEMTLVQSRPGTGKIVYVDGPNGGSNGSVHAGIGADGDAHFSQSGVGQFGTMPQQQSFAHQQNFSQSGYPPLQAGQLQQPQPPYYQQQPPRAQQPSLNHQMSMPHQPSFANPAVLTHLHSMPPRPQYAAQPYPQGQYPPLSSHAPYGTSNQYGQFPDPNGNPSNHIQHAMPYASYAGNPASFSTLPSQSQQQGGVHVASGTGKTGDSNSRGSSPPSEGYSAAARPPNGSNVVPCPPAAMPSAAEASNADWMSRISAPLGAMGNSSLTHSGPLPGGNPPLASGLPSSLSEIGLRNSMANGADDRLIVDEERDLELARALAAEEPLERRSSGVCYMFNTPAGCDICHCRWAHVCKNCAGDHSSQACPISRSGVAGNAGSVGGGNGVARRSGIGAWGARTSSGSLTEIKSLASSLRSLFSELQMLREADNEVNDEEVNSNLAAMEAALVEECTSGRNALMEAIANSAGGDLPAECFSLLDEISEVIPSHGRYEPRQERLERRRLQNGSSDTSPLRATYQMSEQGRTDSGFEDYSALLYDAPSTSAEPPPPRPELRLDGDDTHSQGTDSPSSSLTPSGGSGAEGKIKSLIDMEPLQPPPPDAGACGANCGPLILASSSSSSSSSSSCPVDTTGVAGEKLSAELSALALLPPAAASSSPRAGDAPEVLEIAPPVLPSKLSTSAWLVNSIATPKKLEGSHEVREPVTLRDFIFQADTTLAPANSGGLKRAQSGMEEYTDKGIGTNPYFEFYPTVPSKTSSCDLGDVGLSEPSTPHSDLITPIFTPPTSRSMEAHSFSPIAPADDLSTVVSTALAHPSTTSSSSEITAATAAVADGHVATIVGESGEEGGEAEGAMPVCAMCRNNVDCILLTCAHAVTCQECGRKVASCPSCGAQVLQVLAFAQTVKSH